MECQSVSRLHQPIQMFEEVLDKSCYLRMGLVVTGAVVGAAVVVGNFLGLNL